MYYILYLSSAIRLAKGRTLDFSQREGYVKSLKEKPGAAEGRLWSYALTITGPCGPMAAEGGKDSVGSKGPRLC